MGPSSPTRIEPGPPALGAQNPSHWTTREVLITLLKALYAQPQSLEYILQVTGTTEDFELGNAIIPFEFSKYHSGGSIALFKKGGRKFSYKALSVSRENKDLKKNSVKERTNGR